MRGFVFAKAKTIRGASPQKIPNKVWDFYSAPTTSEPLRGSRPSQRSSEIK